MEGVEEVEEVGMEWRVGRLEGVGVGSGGTTGRNPYMHNTFIFNY